ncbi:MAG: hypothetical protein AAF765_13840 [Bacteroidota bacterium]
MKFEERLAGGHPNSLGNTVEIVEEVLREPARFDEFFNCYFSKDEVVRLRVSNGMKRICAVNSPLIVPYIDRFLDDIAQIEQASTKWTLAQLFLMLETDLTENQKTKAKQILKENLITESDWIVLNQTMETLGKWSKDDKELKAWIQPHLRVLAADTRKSVSKKALKTLRLLN